MKPETEELADLIEEYIEELESRMEKVENDYNRQEIAYNDAYINDDGSALSHFENEMYKRKDKSIEYYNKINEADDLLALLTDDNVDTISEAFQKLVER